LKVVLTADLYHQMLDHALSQPYLEVCGLLGESEGRIKSYYPVDNISERQERAFLMDPADQLRALRCMCDNGEIMTGIFHSHPNTPARPSARDRREAQYAHVYYFIASLQQTTPEIKTFYFDGNEFQDVSISIDQG